VSIRPFNPSLLSVYGTSGRITARKMTSALEDNSLSLSFDEKNKKFTVLSSSKMDKDTIEKIFAKQTYEGWKPEVLDEVDGMGNRWRDVPGSGYVRRIN
jgi:hypothetical protein